MQEWQLHQCSKIKRGNKQQVTIANEINPSQV